MPLSDSSLQVSSNLTIGDWLQSATRLLTNSGIETARLDSLVLLADQLSEDKSYILAHLDTPLSPDMACDLNDAVHRRSNHTPLAYIRGKADFYGREFSIAPTVLVPRPESESIIELLVTHPTLEGMRRDPQLTIADVGTGSGALAVTVKITLPHARVFATDIDPACLDVATYNARIYGTDITCLRGNYVEPLITAGVPSAHCVLLCNLPYVPSGYTVNRAATHEPAQALFAGHDGLEAYRTLFDQLAEVTNIPYAVITESLPQQHNQLAAIAERYGFTHAARDGLAQLFIA